MGRRWRRLAAEVGKFSLVGLLATSVAVVIFNWLLHGFLQGEALLEDKPLSAYVLANTIGMLISYGGTRRWVFKHRSAATADGGFTAYVVINVATMTLPVACLWFSRNVLGLTDPVADNVSANVIGLTAGFVARFYLFRKFVFSTPAQPLAVTATTGPSSGAPARRAGS